MHQKLILVDLVDTLGTLHQDDGHCDALVYVLHMQIQIYLVETFGLLYTACTLKFRPVKLLFVIFGRFLPEVVQMVSLVTFSQFV